MVDISLVKHRSPYCLYLLCTSPCHLSDLLAWLPYSPAALERTIAPYCRARKVVCVCGETGNSGSESWGPWGRGAGATIGRPNWGFKLSRVTTPTLRPVSHEIKFWELPQLLLLFIADPTALSGVSQSKCTKRHIYWILCRFQGCRITPI
jgi:hypothetical protein